MDLELVLFFQRVLREGCALNKLYGEVLREAGVSIFLTAVFFFLYSYAAAVYSLSLVSSFQGLRHEL
jgi:hypothetical protein